MPLLDAFAGRAPDVISNHYQPVVELTRTQVIDQVLRAASKANGVPTPQLSQFASCSVAEEAVSGVSRIWDKMSEFWKYRLNTGCHTSNDKRRVLMPFPGSARTGWISVLEAAILSDIPPEVIARCYHRLTKLCDVPTAKEENYLCQIYADSLVRARRQYVSRKESSEST
ncbi:hypothetical protein EV174_003751 [Coemansia sp. RSA 2320]|nr:hypothetical protein EV174_003751 [Coemansia sp. RSA 2320]